MLSRLNSQEFRAGDDDVFYRKKNVAMVKKFSVGRLKGCGEEDVFQTHPEVELSERSQSRKRYEYCVTSGSQTDDSSSDKSWEKPFTMGSDLTLLGSFHPRFHMKSALNYGSSTLAENSSVEPFIAEIERLSPDDDVTEITGESGSNCVSWQSGEVCGGKDQSNENPNKDFKSILMLGSIAKLRSEMKNIMHKTCDMDVNQKTVGLGGGYVSAPQISAQSQFQILRAPCPSGRSSADCRSNPQPEGRNLRSKRNKNPGVRKGTPRSRNSSKQKSKEPICRSNSYCVSCGKVNNEPSVYFRSSGRNQVVQEGDERKVGDNNKKTNRHSGSKKVSHMSGRVKGTDRNSATTDQVWSTCISDERGRHNRASDNVQVEVSSSKAPQALRQENVKLQPRKQEEWWSWDHMRQDIIPKSNFICENKCLAEKSFKNKENTNMTVPFPCSSCDEHFDFDSSHFVPIVKNDNPPHLNSCVFDKTVQTQEFDPNHEPGGFVITDRNQNEPNVEERSSSRVPAPCNPNSQASYIQTQACTCKAFLKNYMGCLATDMNEIQAKISPCKTPVMVTNCTQTNSNCPDALPTSLDNLKKNTPITKPAPFTPLSAVYPEYDPNRNPKNSEGKKNPNEVISSGCTCHLYGNATSPSGIPKSPITCRQIITNIAHDKTLTSFQEPSPYYGVTCEANHTNGCTNFEGATCASCKEFSPDAMGNYRTDCGFKYAPHNDILVDQTQTSVSSQIMSSSDNSLKVLPLNGTSTNFVPSTLLNSSYCITPRTGRANGITEIYQTRAHSGQQLSSLVLGSTFSCCRNLLTPVTIPPLSQVTKISQQFPPHRNNGNPADIPIYNFEMMKLPLNMNNTLSPYMDTAKQVKNTIQPYCDQTCIIDGRQPYKERSNQEEDIGIVSYQGRTTVVDFTDSSGKYHKPSRKKERALDFMSASFMFNEISENSSSSSD